MFDPTVGCSRSLTTKGRRNDIIDPLLCLLPLSSRGGFHHADVAIGKRLEIAAIPIRDNDAPFFALVTGGYAKVGPKDSVVVECPSIRVAHAFIIDGQHRTRRRQVHFETEFYL